MANKMLSSSSIEGTDVKNGLGENLGQIKDLMINTKKGNIEYAVLSFGGVLGLGDKYFAVPWQAFSVDRDDEEMVLDVNKETLENAPGFDKDNWPSSSNTAYFDSVYKHYNVERNWN